MTNPRRRPGPAPRFSRDQLVDAAVAIVESEGFSALSLRSVARSLGVGPMTLYTYVASSEEIAQLVVERLLVDAVDVKRWPKDWKGVLRLFARRLDALITEHPAMVDAYARGLVGSGLAEQTAMDIFRRLIDDGLTPEQARDAYASVHSLVVGHAVLKSGLAPTPAAGDAATDQDAVWRGLRSVSLEKLVDASLDGWAFPSTGG